MTRTKDQECLDLSIEFSNVAKKFLGDAEPGSFDWSSRVAMIVTAATALTVESAVAGARGDLKKYTVAIHRIMTGIGDLAPNYFGLNKGFDQSAELRDNLSTEGETSEARSQTGET